MSSSLLAKQRYSALGFERDQKNIVPYRCHSKSCGFLSASVDVHTSVGRTCMLVVSLLGGLIGGLFGLYNFLAGRDIKLGLAIRAERVALVNIDA